MILADGRTHLYEWVLIVNPSFQRLTKLQWVSVIDWWPIKLDLSTEFEYFTWEKDCVTMSKQSPLAKGSLILQEKPFAYIVKSKFIKERCDFCLSSGKLLKCGGCQFSHYCGVICQVCSLTCLACGSYLWLLHYFRGMHGLSTSTSVSAWRKLLLELCQMPQEWWPRSSGSCSTEDICRSSTTRAMDSESSTTWCLIWTTLSGMRSAWSISRVCITSWKSTSRRSTFPMRLNCSESTVVCASTVSISSTTTWTPSELASTSLPLYSIIHASPMRSPHSRAHSYQFAWSRIFQSWTGRRFASHTLTKSTCPPRAKQSSRSRTTSIATAKSAPTKHQHRKCWPWHVLKRTATPWVSRTEFLLWNRVTVVFLLSSLTNWCQVQRVWNRHHRWEPSNLRGRRRHDETDAPGNAKHKIHRRLPQSRQEATQSLAQQKYLAPQNIGSCFWRGDWLWELEWGRRIWHAVRRRSQVSFSLSAMKIRSSTDLYRSPSRYYTSEFNPLVGLCSLKLGKILPHLNEFQNALTRLRESSDILKVTHGDMSRVMIDFVRPLLAETQILLEQSQRIVMPESTESDEEEETAPTA